jgi:small-conductance mechanosensitive channel
VGSLPTLGGFSYWLTQWLARLVAYLSIPDVIVQIVVIAVIALATWWLAPRFDLFLKRIALATVPRSLVPGIVRVLVSIRTALLGLLLLWSMLVLANSAGHDFRIVQALASLAAAWIVIRFASQFVNSATWSIAIAVVAWTIAALSIIGLLGAIVHQLDQSAVNVGKLRISALTAIRGLLAFSILLWLTMSLVGILERRINAAAALTPAIRTVIIQILRLLLPSLAVVGTLSIVGVDLTALAIFSGVVGIGIGLGLQQTMANFLAGLALVLGKSVQPGDVIGYGGSFGWVTHMGARYVSIRTRDGIAHHIPNSYFIANGVENWSHYGDAIRLHIPVTVGYDADLNKAIELCLGAARSVKRVLDKPEPVCLVTLFGDSAIHLDLRIWIEDPPQGVTNVKSAVMLGIWQRFHDARIRFPYPQREIHVAPSSEGVLDAEQRQELRGILHS